MSKILELYEKLTLNTEKKKFNDYYKEIMELIELIETEIIQKHPNLTLIDVFEKLRTNQFEEIIDIDVCTSTDTTETTSNKNIKAELEELRKLRNKIAFNVDEGKALKEQFLQLWSEIVIGPWQLERVNGLIVNKAKDKYHNDIYSIGNHYDVYYIDEIRLKCLEILENLEKSSNNRNKDKEKTNE